MLMDFSSQPPRSERFVVIHGEKPLNAEPSVEQLIQHNVTPLDLHYARNHGPIKPIDPATHTLRVQGKVERELELKLDDLKRYPRAEVVAVLQCAGNRRATMETRTGRGVEGIKWGEGAVANSRWAGARLRDVLNAAGVDESSKDKLYLRMACHVTACEKDSWFGATIPLSKAIDFEGDTLIAYEINGEPLPAYQGAPFRIIIPGYTGARWVKAVDSLVVSTCECDNFYQKRDYKILPAGVASHDQADAENWWGKLPPIMSNPLNSVIGLAQGVHDESGPGVRIAGYATGGATGGQVTRVEYSTDGGKHWFDAQITYSEGRWSWVLWSAVFKIGSQADGGPQADGKRHIWSRATDESGQVQMAETTWNLRGVVYCAYGEAVF